MVRTKAKAARANTEPKVSVVEEINSQILAILESGEWSKWVKEWCPDVPQNPFSGTLYKGSNRITCSLYMYTRGYKNNLWATFAQLQDKGYYPKKGVTKGKFIPLLAPNLFKTEDDDGNEVFRVKGFSAFRVINVNPDYIGEAEGAKPLSEFLEEFYGNADNEPIPSAEDFTKEYLSREGISIENGEPSYNPVDDRLFMPDLSRFSTSEAYYATLAHEIAHSTGHKSRLNRGLDGTFGSEAYAREELIAELSAVYTCAHLGVSYQLENHASYLASWAKGLRADEQYFLKAATAAQKVLEYLTEAK